MLTFHTKNVHFSLFLVALSLLKPAGLMMMLKALRAEKGAEIEIIKDNYTIIRASASRKTAWLQRLYDQFGFCLDETKWGTKTNHKISGAR